MLSNPKRLEFLILKTNKLGPKKEKRTKDDLLKHLPLLIGSFSGRIKIT